MARAPQHVWDVRCGRLENDDALALVFGDDWYARNELMQRASAEVQQEILRIRAGLPVAEATPTLLIDMYGDWGRAFVRGADGRYERVEERDYEVDVVASAVVAPDSKVTIRWEWRGIPQRLATLGPDRASERRKMRFRAPREGVTLSWSTEEEHVPDSRAGAGSVPLDAATITVELP